VSRSLDETRSWAAEGGERFGDALAGLTDEDLRAPSALPGWSRAHLIAHVAANAVALGNLVTWAATGERTPMYASIEQRNADIEAGSRRSRDDLLAWFERSQAELLAATDALPGPRWDAEVATARGQAVPASDIPWMRAREVMVHRVDLRAGASFADLPEGFLGALATDIARKRGAEGTGPALELRAVDTDTIVTVRGEGALVRLHGTLAAVAAYLAGRDHDLETHDGAPVPALPGWR
jgi:uncharacterized protein (TIGR03083 family)